jgi:UDP-N-acetyl-D-mannosaminuronic acid dehydrogenase
VDVDPARRAHLTGDSGEIAEPGVRAALDEALAAGRIEAASAPVSCEVTMICVPTSEAAGGLDALAAVAEQVACVLDDAPRGACVMVISTTPPGTTRGLVANALASRGFTPGEGVFVAHCPERISPGQAMRELEAHVRVVGGVTPACAEACAAQWRSLGAQVLTASAEEAEAAKLFENTFRYVNVALANELADVCEASGLDAVRVFSLANTHPRVALHRFGVGAGGRCLPMSARMVAAMGTPRAGLVRGADAALVALPARLADEIAQAVPDGATVALLGASYKAGAPGLEASPAAALWHRLEQAGLIVRVVEPSLADAWKLGPACEGADAVILAVGHALFAGLDPTALIATMRGRLAVDLCRGWEGARWRAAGFEYRGRGLGVCDDT